MFSEPFIWRYKYAGDVSDFGHSCFMFSWCIVSILLIFSEGRMKKNMKKLGSKTLKENVIEYLSNI